MELRHLGDRIVFSGERGELTISKSDEVGWKLAMLIEGHCEAGGAADVAPRYGYCSQRYYQLSASFAEGGTSALIPGKRGPKRNYRRTPEVHRQVIRYRYLDPDVSPEVIAQKLRQNGWPISTRSVFRIFQDFGLQKKGSTNAARGTVTPPRR